jgi:hypothetical protein
MIACGRRQGGAGQSLLRRFIRLAIIEGFSIAAEKFYPSTENVPSANVKPGKGVIASTDRKAVELTEERFLLDKSHACILDFARGRRLTESGRHRCRRFRSLVGHPDPQGVHLRNEWVHTCLHPAGIACAEHVVDARQDRVYSVRAK